MQPIIPIFKPFKCEVASLIRAMVCCKLNKVRPQPGQEMYSVLEVRIRPACKIPKAVASITAWLSEPWLKRKIPSHKPSNINAPISAAAFICRSSATSS